MPLRWSLGICEGRLFYNDVTPDGVLDDGFIAVGMGREGYRYKKKGQTTGPAFSHMRLRTGAATVLE